IMQNSPIDLICPRCLRGFPRSDVLYAHFRNKKKDPIHQRLNQRKTNFRNFLTYYNLALGELIRPEELPIDYHCFEWQYVLEHHRAESQR
ncbi:hypothetical protein BO71DRAFT_292959, partial [Aspergillus ellipticus CBS 707.79]